MLLNYGQTALSTLMAIADSLSGPRGVMKNLIQYYNRLTCVK